MVKDPQMKLFSCFFFFIYSHSLVEFDNYSEHSLNSIWSSAPTKLTRHYDVTLGI